MSDQRLAEQIRADRIDVLFDLAGHTAHNRLLVFARKPAPIQVTWAGYVGTTGLKAMDYLLADRYEVPPGAERHYQERVLRMPDGYVCYDPPAYAPPVTPLPALDRGTGDLWLFQQSGQDHAPGDRSLGQDSPPAAGRTAGAEVSRDGTIAALPGDLPRCSPPAAIDPGRLELLGHSPHAELLAEYNRIDLALDPFPYSRRLDHLRGVMDGRAGDYLPWRDLCQPAFAQPPLQRGSDGDDCPRLGRVRGTGGFLGGRPAATGGAAGGFAGADGRLAPLRREAICDQLGVDLARRSKLRISPIFSLGAH